MRMRIQKDQCSNTKRTFKELCELQRIIRSKRGAVYAFK